jgi:uncharacterized protein (TIGR03437 family)
MRHLPLNHLRFQISAVLAIICFIFAALVSYPSRSVQAFLPNILQFRFLGMSNPGDLSHEAITENAIQELLADPSFLSPPITKPSRSKSIAEAIRNIRSANVGVDKADFFDMLRGLITPAAHHFDGESFPEGQQRLFTLLQKIQAALNRNDEGSARTALGQALHAIQDFYAHSNWIERQVSLGLAPSPHPDLGVPGRSLNRLPEEIATCKDFSLSSPACRDNLIVKDQLTSGYYVGTNILGQRVPEDRLKTNPNKCSHGGASDETANSGEGINKDSSKCENSPHGDLHLMAASVAKEATKQFIREVVAPRVTPSQFKRLLGVGEAAALAGPTLAIAIDTTASMNDIIKVVKEQAVNLVNTRRHTPDAPVKYILAPFNDPDVPEPFVTNDPDAFIAEIENLSGPDGGDCAERSLMGMLKALAVADSGQLFMFTDAQSKEQELASKVGSLALSKKMKIFSFQFASDCFDAVFDSIYTRVASDSGGQAFFLPRDEADGVANLVDFIARSNAVDLLQITDTLAETAKTYAVPIDSMLTRVTFSVSEATSVVVKRADGSTVQPTDAGVSLIALSRGAIYSIINPAAGTWSVTVNGSGDFSLKASGESRSADPTSASGSGMVDLVAFQFVELGGRPGHEGFFPIAGFPLAGQTNAVIAELTTDIATAQFELRTKDGALLTTLNLTEESSNLFKKFAGEVPLSTTPFVVCATGLDLNGKAYQRVLPGTIQPQPVMISAPASLDLVPGRTATYIFQVKNIGAVDTFVFSAADDKGAAIDLSPSSFTLNTNQTINVTVQLTLPDDVPLGASDTLTVTVESTGSSAASNFAVVTSTVVSPIPAITSLSPTAIGAGASGLTLTVTGTDFINGSTVHWNGSPRATTFASPTELRAEILPTDLATGGSATITVFNPPPGGGLSNSLPFSVIACPTITSLSPATGTIGSTVTISGTGLIGVTTVKFANNIAASFAVIDDTKLTAIVPSGAVTGPLTLSKPGCPDVITSSFTICPAVSGISPTIGAMGSSVTINGSGFTGVTKVQFTNNATAPFTIISDQQIVATVPCGATTGQITLVKPGCPDTKTPTFTVSNPRATITSLTPNMAIEGGPDFILTVKGTNFLGIPGTFTACSTVRWGGSNRTTHFVSNTELKAEIGAADIATVGTDLVTVFNPAPGGGTSTNSQTFTTKSRVVQVAPVTTAPGNNVSVSIELVTAGDVNALGFSLSFDPAILSNPQVALGADAGGAMLPQVNPSQTAQGRLGIGLAMPAGQKFADGTRQIVVVTFAVAPDTTATLTTIDFADQPVTREASGVSANVLHMTHTKGTVTITQSLEADVAPRSTGGNNNGTVTITDWVQVCRFAAGLDTANAGAEFQRADCAPRATLGDGQITTTDCTQAGRYAIGLDPVTTAGGPTSLTPTAAALVSTTHAAAAEMAGARIMRAVAGASGPDQTHTLTLALDAQGNENALGLSLLFNPSEWRLVNADVGSDANGAALYLNANQAASGRIGVILALSAGQTLAAGTRQLAVFTFAPVSGNSARPMVFGFGDYPVRREVADVSANSLAVAYAHTLANVSAASFRETELASEAIVSAFGTDLAIAAQAAHSLPLPTQLAGTSVTIKDSEGIERLAPLFFVSPGQINYQIPPGTATGTATVIITSGDGSVSTGVIEIAQVAPSLFAANSNGQGVAAAVALRVADGASSYEPVAEFDVAQNQFIARPLDLGPPEDQMFLLLFGTGLRHRSDLSAVRARIGNEDAEVFYAGLQGGFAGLDQINLRVPRSLAGRGEIEIVLMVDGKMSNPVRVTIK